MKKLAFIFGAVSIVTLLHAACVYEDPLPCAGGVTLNLVSLESVAVPTITTTLTTGAGSSTASYSGSTSGSLFAASSGSGGVLSSGSGTTLSSGSGVVLSNGSGTVLSSGSGTAGGSGSGGGEGSAGTNSSSFGSSFGTGAGSGFNSSVGSSFASATTSSVNSSIGSSFAAGTSSTFGGSVGSTYSSSYGGGFGSGYSTDSMSTTTTIASPATVFVDLAVLATFKCSLQGEAHANLVTSVGTFTSGVTAAGAAASKDAGAATAAAGTAGAAGSSTSVLLTGLGDASTRDAGVLLNPGPVGTVLAGYTTLQLTTDRTAQVQVSVGDVSMCWSIVTSDIVDTSATPTSLLSADAGQRMVPTACSF